MTRPMLLIAPLPALIAIPLFGWAAFGSAGMLAWGAAAVIPVLIHLWSRRQQHELHWAAMQFLLAALQKQARRLRVEHWILLTVRVAILLLLALALADPFLASLPAWPVTGPPGRAHTVLVMDGTFSMGSRSGSESRFELAQDRALRLVEAGSQGDGFTLLLMSDPPQIVVREAVFDPQDLADEIEALEFHHSARGFMATLSEVERTLDRVSRHHPGFTEHRVCFLTDLGRATWAEIETEAARKKLADLAAKAQLFVLPVGQGGRPNLAITQLSTATPWPAAGSEVALQVRIKNYGSRRLRTQLQIAVDDRRLAEHEFELAAASEVVRTVLHRFESAGQHVIEARIADDPLPTDNRRWLSLPVPNALRVLCVEGRRGAAELAALALAPDAQHSPLIQPKVVGESGLLELDLREFDCVMLCNLARFRPEEGRLLEQYVRDGGGLLTLLGDQVEVDSYNAELGGDVSGIPLLPARLGQVSGDGALRYFDPLQYRHPIVAPFRGHERAGLLTAPIWRYFRLEPHPGESQVALALDDGSPVLVTAVVGRGRSLLLGTATSPDAVGTSSAAPTPWTALPLWTCFPPLMHEMVYFAAQGRLERQNVLVGEPLVGTLTAGPQGPLMMEDPTGAGAQLPISFEVSPPRWSYEDTRLSGIYRVTTGRQHPPQLFAVNVDNEESDLQRIDVAALPGQFVPLQEHDGLESASDSGPTPPPLYRLLLAALLVMIVTESAVGWWFGREEG